MGSASWVVERFKYQQIASSIDSSVRLVTKDAWIWRSIAALLSLLPSGETRSRKFLEDYASAIGPLQGYPRGWDALSKRLLIHECRHTTHCVWLGWLVPIAGWFFGRRVRAWCGLPLYGVLYLFVPLPLGLAYMRYRAEIDCDITMYRWGLHHGYDAAWARKRAQDFSADVCGSIYGWSWLSRRGFIAAAEQAIEEYERGRADHGTA